MSMSDCVEPMQWWLGGSMWDSVLSQRWLCWVRDFMYKSVMEINRGV